MSTEAGKMLHGLKPAYSLDLAMMTVHDAIFKIKITCTYMCKLVADIMDTQSAHSSCSVPECSVNLTPPQLSYGPAGGIMIISDWADLKKSLNTVYLSTTVM